MAAAEMNKIPQLTQFIRNAPADFDWNARYTVEDRENHETISGTLAPCKSHNIFHAVADGGSISSFSHKTASIIVKELKRRGVDLKPLINATTHDEYQGTPTHFAVEALGCLELSESRLKNGIKLLEILIDNGADVTIPYRGLFNGFLPLHLATQIEDNRPAKLLLDADVRALSMKDDSGLTPIIRAAKDRRQDLLEYFLQSLDADELEELLEGPEEPEESEEPEASEE